MYIVNPNEYKKIFAVPSSITEKHIKTAGALSLKVLLLVLSQPQITAQKMAETLCVSVGDIQDAANYWVVNNVLSTSEEQAFSTSNIQPLTEGTPIKRVSQAPVRLTGKELEKRVKESSDVKLLISETEKYFGKNLIPSEASVLVSLYDWAGLSVDIILMIASYCASINKTNMRFVEKLSLEWIDKGIDSHEAVANHIMQLTEKNTNESAVKSAFGIYNRSLTTKEKNFINSWFVDMRFDIEMIKLAYEKTIDATNNMSFDYINKILTSWNEKGIRTPVQVEEEQKIFTSSRKNHSLNPSYDLDGIDKLTNDKIV